MKRIVIFFLLLSCHTIYAQLHTDTLRSGYHLTVRTLYGTFLLEEELYAVDSGSSGCVFFDLMFVTRFNFVSGCTETSQYIKGKLYHWYEEANDTIDVGEAFYYLDGASEEGARRNVPVYNMDSIAFYAGDSLRLIPATVPKPAGYKAPTRVGTWHFYYPNGRDSAVGNYAYEMYSGNYELPRDTSSPFQGWVAYASDGIKDGEWRYYSRDGRLLYVEEWNKDVLVKKEEK